LHERTTLEAPGKPEVAWSGWVLVDPDCDAPRAGRVGRVYHAYLADGWACYSVRFPDNCAFDYWHQELSKWTVA
jgi:hypothetical protein